MKNRSPIVATADQIRFTDRYVAALKPSASRYIVWEAGVHGLGSLGLRVATSGKKSWVYMYGGRRRRFMTLGTYPVIGVAGAHQKAVEAMAAVEAGKDPALKLKDHRTETRDAPTVSDLVSEYIERHAKIRKKTWKSDEYYLKRELLPEFGSWRAVDVRRRDMLRVLEQIRTRSPTQACRVHEIVRKMYNWAIEAEIAEINPCHGISRLAKPTRRDRVLTGAELRGLWAALKTGLVVREAEIVDLSVSEPVRIGLQLALLTLARRSELELAEWKEVDLQARWWTVPGDRTKNRLPHRVHLNGTARFLMKRLHELTGETGFLFPGRREGYPVTLRCFTRAIARIRTELRAEHYHVHDLRRTAATYLSRARVPRLTIKKLLNHVDPDITAVYDRNSYDVEKREVMLIWDGTLQDILACRELDRSINKVVLAAA